MDRTFEVGDKIAYTADFVRGPGGYSDDVGKRRGTVVGHHKLAFGDRTFPRVKWDDEDNTALVHPKNICRVGSPAMYA
jgi:hypothetical protein